MATIHSESGFAPVVEAELAVRINCAQCADNSRKIIYRTARALLLAAVWTLTWLSHPHHATPPRKPVQCATINRLTSAEFTAQFDHALETHWQTTPRAVQWARQYRVGSRLTATMTPQRTALHLVSDSQWHLARVIETWTALLVKVSPPRQAHVY